MSRACTAFHFDVTECIIEGAMRSLAPWTRLLCSLLFTLGLAGLASAAPGDLDATFGSGGKVITDLGTTDDDAFAIALQPDGKIVVAGGFGSFGNLARRFVILRYDAGGGLDATFGSAGKVTGNFGGEDEEARQLVLQPDGRILVAVLSGTNFLLTRFSPDGSLDDGFGGGGAVLTPFNGVFNDPRGIGVAVQADGKIVVAGDCWFRSCGDFAVTRYLPNGSLDAAFGSAGLVTTSFTDGLGAEVNAAAVQNDGKILVAGQAIFPTSVAFALARYHPDGSLDAGFGNAGVGILRGPGVNNWDITASKRIPLRSEERFLQFRTELFNAWNHTQFASLFTAARFDAQGRQVDSNFGAFRAARPARIIQLSLKVVF